MNEDNLRDILIRVRGAGEEKAHSIIVLRADKGVGLRVAPPETLTPASSLTIDHVASEFFTENERRGWLVLVVKRLEKLTTGPITIGPSLRIVDVAKFTESTIQDLVTYLAAKNRDSYHWVDRVLDEKLEYLELCGITAEIRSVQ